MTIRFFILQAHYRSTVDFSNEALQLREGLVTLDGGIRTFDEVAAVRYLYRRHERSS